MGAAANNSIVSARMAAAGIASNTGTVGSTLGGTIGTYDSDAVTAGLGLRWEVERNYFKRHAACAFTHPPLDAALSLRSQLGGSEQGIASIESIDVHTHYLAQSLNAPSPQTRLAAMFSIPYVISAALIDGELTPRQHDQSSLSNDQIASLASRVHVHNDPEFSANLPDKRGAKVIIRFIDGSEVSEQAIVISGHSMKQIC
jgi:2-methylcitrate dehydratase PrpD